MAITVAQVRQIAKLPTDVAVLPDANVQNYINAANVVFGEIPPATSAGWATEKQDLITLYLAAHFAVLSEEFGGFTQQVVGESEEHYQAMSGKDVGLATTRFGKTAISLDSSGTLGKLAAKPLRALFGVYDDRYIPPCEVA